MLLRGKDVWQIVSHGPRCSHFGKGTSLVNGVTVSIVIPAFNPGRLLLAALESAKQNAATLAHEILIVDDRSTDPETHSVFAEIRERSPTVMLLRNEGVRGPGPTRNVGIFAARGDWIAFLDADDVWPPGSLERRIKVAQKFPAVKWIAGGHLVWHPENTELDSYAGLVGHSAQAMSASGNEFFIEKPLPLLINHTILVGTMLIRREILTASGGFDEHCFFADDWMFNILVAEYSTLYFIDVALLLLRRQHRSLTSDIRYRIGALATYDRACARRSLAAHMGEIKARKLSDLLLLSEHFAQRKQWREALRFTWSALMAHPTAPWVWRRALKSLVALCYPRGRDLSRDDPAL
jgi:glycosyltransferase involved in cell wall biosynthesis